jgi:hypothetical protein
MVSGGDDIRDPDEDGVSCKRYKCLEDSVGGMWEMLLVSHWGERGYRRGFTPSDWGKKGERNEVDWYEDDAGSVPSSESVPDEEDLSGEGYVFELDLFGDSHLLKLDLFDAMRRIGTPEKQETFGEREFDFERELESGHGIRQEWNGGRGGVGQGRESW